MAQWLVLIGMPGAGKSTLGRALAERTANPFVDTDRVIETQFGQTLQALLAERGYLGLRELEGQVVASCALPARAVVATGGSVVYSPVAMQRLKSGGLCVYLSVSADTVAARVTNWQNRGFAGAPGHTLAQVYAERDPLYRRYADVTLACDERTPAELVNELHRLWV